MTAEGTLEHIRALADKPRPAGTAEYREKARYVLEQARAAGFDARIIEHSASGGTLYNVVADRRGTAPDADRKLVIAGAHLDSVPRAPGANDNASGSATLLELAESLDGLDTKNDVRLLWFDGEERGLLGSAAYVRDHRGDLDRAVVMLNADMVGSQFATQVGFSMAARTSTAVGDAIKGVALRNDVPATFLDERHSRSDHASFDRAGVPAVDFGVSVRTVGNDDPNYHSPRDTIDKINPQILEGYGDLLALSLYEFAAADKRLLTPAAPRPARPITGPPK